MFKRELRSSVPGVWDCAAVGVPDARRGERQASFVVPLCATSYDGPVSEVRRQDETHLGRYRQPKMLCMALELPRSATGKLLRRELRKQLPPDLEDPG